MLGLLGVIATGTVDLVKSWFGVKKAKNDAEAAYHARAQESEANWDLEAQRAAKYSWKDEFITIVWFTPLIMAWWDEERAQAWVNFVSGLPYWYQFGMFGIIAASFGLRWYFKQQSFKVSK